MSQPKSDANRSAAAAASRLTERRSTMIGAEASTVHTTMMSVKTPLGLPRPPSGARSSMPPRMSPKTMPTAVKIRNAKPWTRTAKATTGTC